MQLSFRLSIQWLAATSQEDMGCDESTDNEYERRFCTMGSTGETYGCVDCITGIMFENSVLTSTDTVPKTPEVTCPKGHPAITWPQAQPATGVGAYGIHGEAY
jgi:hypothetical protein